MEKADYIVGDERRLASVPIALLLKSTDRLAYLERGRSPDVGQQIKSRSGAQRPQSRTGSEAGGATGFTLNNTHMGRARRFCLFVVFNADPVAAFRFAPGSAA